VRYARGADEVRFLAHLFEGTQILAVASGGNQLLPQLLTQRAASSIFAAEQSLQRLRQVLASRVTNITAPIEADSDAVADSEDLGSEGKTIVSAVANVSSALKLVEQCREALESVNTDEKLKALKALVRSIAVANPGQSPRMCIFSMYMDTVAYLHSALQDAGTKVFKITGGNTFADRAVIVEEFRSADGLLVGTDAGISEGIQLPDVTHVIHYDVPTNPMAMEQRRGRVDRYGRTAPCTMYVFRDDSKAIPFESEVIDRLAVVPLADDKASAPTDYADPDGSISH
jgi:ERCC4-related helicase